jgi:hypothetical protein
MAAFSEYVDSRTCKLEKITLVGFQGESMDDEKQLFARLHARMNELPARLKDHPYLVVSGKFPVPLVAVEVSDSAHVPEGMTALTLPKGEYVAFAFPRQHVGDFWANVCTSENQAKYKIDLSKPRFEMFTSALQDAGRVEWYIPTK